MIVLDASALILMLKGERGASKVAAAIATARMSAINFAEVVSHFVQSGAPAREVDMMLDPLPIEIVPATKAHGQIAGRLRALTAQASLSLGDRFCLALAQMEGLPAWTADPQWAAVAAACRVKVVLIR